MSSLLGKEPPEWKDGAACQQCQTKFTLITRKHHCRTCGGVFCSRCSSQTQVLPKFGTQPVRVCDACAKIPPPSPRIDIKPNVSQSPPREESPLNTSMTRSVFESWIGEEAPKARWVSDPPFSAYGVSPPPGSTPPEFFLDLDMQVKTAKEMEEERERELAALEERKKRKEEKKREKERKRLIEEEKERLRKQQPEESGGHTPPSENDIMSAHLDNSTLMTDSTELPSTPVLGTSQGEAAVSTPPGDNNVSEQVATSEHVAEAQSGEVGVRQRRTTGKGSRREPNRPTDQNNRQRTSTVSTGLGNKAKELVFAFLAGLIDSFRLKYAFITLFRSKTVYYRARDVLILNVLLLGSYMLFFNVLVPHFDNVLNWKEHKSTTIIVIVSIVNFLLNSIFWLLWLLPLFALSFVLNAHWYQGIAYGSFGLHTFWKKGVKVNADNRSIATVIGEALYRNLIFGAFLGLGYVCYFIPYIGAPLYFVNLCWIYSVYCYEYKWNNQSWGLTRKLEYFETRWIYFAGFGAPIASLSFFLDYFTGYALVSLLFPVFIPIAMYGSPSRQKAWMPIPLSRFVDNSILTPVILFIKNQVTFLDLRNKF